MIVIMDGASMARPQEVWSWVSFLLKEPFRKGKPLCDGSSFQASR